MTTAASEFLRKAVSKSADLPHRQLIRRNIDHYDRAVQRGRARFADLEAARQRAQEIRWEAINHLDRYLLQFEAKVKERGGHVFWAENTEQARQYITDLAARNNVKRIVKSKSMVAEEIGLLHALEGKGIEVFETDLGEFIVQLRHEPPYHIVTPAMHLSRSDIAALFREKLKSEDGAVLDTDDPPRLVAAARHALRQAFFSSEMGITGANFLVADSGAVAVTTNEGNADLGMILPRIHVVLTGIEKVIPHLDDLALMWPLLSTSGTGQAITCYNTLIAGARNANETSGPEEFHVVLLDNGRTQLLADPEQREVLHCIRCGACLNACPVFRTIGGHTYGTTYSGPIGSVLSPHLLGLNEFQHLSYASSLCGACTEVCPVKIELHRHLLHNRRNAVDPSERPEIAKGAKPETAERSPAERFGFALWRWTMMSSRRFAALGLAGRGVLRLLYLLGLENTPFDPLRAWTRNRAAPHIPAKSFRALWKEHAAD